MSDIDSILEGKTVEVVAEVVTPEVTPEVPETTETTGEKEQVAAAPEEVIDWKAELEKSRKEAAAFKTQALDERRKRQELEASKQETPDVLIDQKAFEDHVLSAADQRILNAKLDTSEALLREKLGDEATDKAFERFQELVKENPQLQQEALNSKLPWQTMHKIVERSSRLEEMKDVDKYEAKVRGEIEAKIRAEVEAKVKAEMEADAKIKGIRPSLAGAASKGGVGGATWTGPASLDSVLN